MSFDINLGSGDGAYPPDRLFLDQLETQFVRIGGLLLDECQQPVPVPPQLVDDHNGGVFEVDVEALGKELDKGLAGRVSLRLEGPNHVFGHSIAGALSGRPFSLEQIDGIVRMGVYTDAPLTPVLYGNVPRGSFLGGDRNEPAAAVFATVEMPPIIADFHELFEANQERARAGELKELGRRKHTAAHDLIDYNKKLRDAGAEPHYLNDADQKAIIRMIEASEPQAGWTLDCNLWAVK